MACTRAGLKQRSSGVATLAEPKEMTGPAIASYGDYVVLQTQHPEGCPHDPIPRWNRHCEGDHDEL